MKPYRPTSPGKVLVIAIISATLQLGGLFGVIAAIIHGAITRHTSATAIAWSMLAVVVGYVIAKVHDD